MAHTHARRPASPRRAAPWRSVLLLAALAGALGCAAGCAASAPDPGDGIADFVQAVRDKDARKVYAMLGPDARMGMDEGAFVAWFEANHAVALEDAEAMARSIDATPPQVHARVPLGMGHAAQLTLHDGRWALTNRDLSAASRGTPHETVDAFIAALERGDLETLLALMSTDRRNAYTGELDALRRMMTEALERGLVTQGDQAVMRLSNGAKVILIREGNAWKIKAFD